MYFCDNVGKISGKETKSIERTKEKPINGFKK